MVPASGACPVKWLELLLRAQFGSLSMARIPQPVASR